MCLDAGKAFPPDPEYSDGSRSVDASIGTPLTQARVLSTLTHQLNCSHNSSSPTTKEEAEAGEAGTCSQPYA